MSGSDRILEFGDEAPAGLFAISLELAKQIPREWDDLVALPGLSHIPSDVSVVEWASSRVSSIGDLSRVRVIERSERAQWQLWADAEDGALGGWDEATGANAGFWCVGQRLDMTYLSRGQQVLLTYLMAQRSRELSAPEKAIQGALLALCPREVRLPPIDLDAQTKSKHYAAHESRGTAATYARMIRDYVAGRPEFGSPYFYSTNAEKGSIHVDFLAPEGVKSAYLVEAWGQIAIPMLVRLGIPVNTVDADMDEQDRPPIVADGTIYRKYPHSRGGLWRPPGASKQGASQPKRLIPDLSRYDERVIEPKRARDWEGRAISPDLLRRAIARTVESPSVARRRASVEKGLRAVLSGRMAQGARVDRPDLAIKFVPGAQAQAEAQPQPAPKGGRPRESRSAPGEEIGNVAAASRFAETFRRLPSDGRADAAAAACMLGRYPAEVVATGLVDSGRRSHDEARALVAAIRFQDHGDAWRFVVEGLGEKAARDLVHDLHPMRQIRSRSFFVPPHWATAMLTMVESGMRPLSERDIPNEGLRRYVQSNEDLLHAWFRVTGDRSGDESAFAKACHRTGTLSAEETIYLCVLKPGSKSGSDHRGRDYAEHNVVSRVEESLGPFGPGVTDAPDAPDVDPAVAEEQRLQRQEEAARIKAERAERFEAFQREHGVHMRVHEWVTVHLLGEAPLERTATALSSVRLSLAGCTGDLHGAAELAAALDAATKAVACWLLTEGVPQPAVVGTLAKSGICLRKTAEDAVDEAAKANGRYAKPGEEWIKAKLPDVHAVIAPVLAAELLERNEEARRTFIRERDEKIARAHLAQAAHDLPDAGLDGTCRAHAPPAHEHGPGCGESCGHGQGRPPDEPPRIGLGGPPPLYRLSKRLKDFFTTPSKVYGPKAAATVLSFLLGFGMPGTVAASTFRHAGLPEAEHVWDTMRENARKHPEALRAAVTKEIGERAVSRMVASIERDLVMGADSLDPVTRSRLYQNFVGRWSLLPEERDYMLVLAAAAKDRKPTRLPGMGAAERAAEHALNERIKKTRRGLQYAAKCGIFRQYMKCPTHGDRGSRALVTDREIMCRHCAWRWARGYRDWIAQKWPEKVNVVKVEIPAWSSGPGAEAPFDARDRWRTTAEHMREVSVAASRIKSARWGDVYDRVTAGDHEAPPPADPAAEQPDEDDVDEGSGAWSKWVVGTKPTEDTGFQALNKRPKRWVYGRDHFLVIMPIEVVEQKEAGAKVVEHRRPQGQYLHLFAEAHRRLGRKVTEAKPLTGHPLTHHEQQAWRYAVTREEAAKQVYETLMSLNQAFDDMLRDRDPWLGYFEWLAPGIKRTTATDGGKQALSWPDRDQIRKFMSDSNKDATETESEEEVEGGRCDADVPDESDPERKRTRKCRLACHIILAHEPTQTVIAQNTQGILYGIDDALARANELGVPETLPFDDLE